MTPAFSFAKNLIGLINHIINERKKQKEGIKENGLRNASISSYCFSFYLISRMGAVKIHCEKSS